MTGDIVIKTHTSDKMTFCAEIMY